MTPNARRVYGVPVQELFGCFSHRNFNRKLFALFTGYIDDSGSKESNLFTLSCLVGWGSQWFWFEQAWIKLLEETNKSLEAQGRKQLSRYHAADCSSCYNDFQGWTRDEQIEFTTKIINIFRRHPMLIASYTVNLRELVDEIPETKPSPLRFAYVILLNHLMIEIGNLVVNRKEYSNDRVALIHDRCDYDAALLEMFNYVKADPAFKYRNLYSTIAPMSWEDCVPLQPADLLMKISKKPRVETQKGKEGKLWNFY